MAAIIPKEALCQEENITSKTSARSHVNKETRQKTIFLVFGGYPARGQPKPPHPRLAIKFCASHMGSRQIEQLKCQNESPNWGSLRGGGGGGHFSNNSTTKQYFKILISHNKRVFLAPSLLQCQSSPISFLRLVKREKASYIVERCL
jgi:hypothetical protein